MKRSEVRRLTRHTAVRGTMRLSVAAAVTQLLPLATLSLFTRLYSPDEVGRYAIFAVAAATASMIAGGRYDVGVMLAESDRDAALLGAASTWIAGLTSSLLAVLAAIAMSTHWLGSDLGPALLAFPAVVFLNARFSALSNVALRTDAVAAVSTAEVSRATVVVLAQLTLGLADLGLAGLVLSTVLGGVVGNAVLPALPRVAPGGRRPLARELWTAVTRYRHLPQYDAASSFLNSASQAATIFGVGLVYSPLELGWYSMALRLTSLPLLVVGSATGRTLFRQLGERARSGAPLGQAFRRSAGLLVGIAIVTYGLLAGLAPAAVPVILGPDWRETGFFLVAACPAMCIKLVASPLSCVLLIANWHRALTAWQAGLLAMTIGLLAAAALLDASARQYAMASGAALAALYGFLLYLSYRSALRPKTRPDRHNGPQRPELPA
jgi:O-antigen/teichoic acid export membrane protein